MAKKVASKTNGLLKATGKIGTYRVVVPRVSKGKMECDIYPNEDGLLFTFDEAYDFMKKVSKIGNKGCWAEGQEQTFNLRSADNGIANPDRL